MECPKCTGQMIREKYFDYLDCSKRRSFVGHRCVNCGEINDLLILQNRKSQMAAEGTGKRKAPVRIYSSN